MSENLNQARKQMNIIRELVAELADEAKDVCYSYGLKSIDRCSISLRDSNKDNLWIVVTDDPAGEFVWWRDPTKELPPEFEPVLIMPTTSGGETGYHNGDSWRTLYGVKINTTDVLAWMPMPEFNGVTR